MSLNKFSALPNYQLIPETPVKCMVNIKTVSRIPAPTNEVSKGYRTSLYRAENQSVRIAFVSETVIKPPPARLKRVTEPDKLLPNLT